MTILLFILFLYGLLVGSFLNAWIWRIKTNRKISHGRSMCPDCKHPLRWYDLVPVLSWIFLGGRCRYCKRPISKQYPLVEISTALLWVALGYVIAPASIQAWLQLGIWLIVGSLLIAAFVYDAKWMLLPDQFMIPSILIGIFWNLVLWLVFGQAQLALQQTIGAILFGGFYFLMWYMSGGTWLGDGDIRLALIMGLLLTPAQLVVAIFLTYLIGAIVSIALIVSGRKTRRDPIAFGPFLIAATFISFFFANTLITYYLNLFA